MIRVLIVERVPFMRNITRFALECSGHEVIGEAVDGQQALDLFHLYKPDLVILALVLQKIQGIQVLRRIKETCPDSKIIICSAIKTQRMIDQAMEFGADSYIIKPFQIYSFISEVNRVLGLETTPQELVQKQLLSEREELEQIAAKVLTRTISRDELQNFIHKVQGSSHHV